MFAPCENEVVVDRDLLGASRADVYNTDRGAYDVHAVRLVNDGPEVIVTGNWRTDTISVVPVVP